MTHIWLALGTMIVTRMSVLYKAIEFLCKTTFCNQFCFFQIVQEPNTRRAGPKEDRWMQLRDEV